MSLAETIYRHSLRLPEQAAQEALDFIKFLEQRYSTSPAFPKAPPDQETLMTTIAGIEADDSSGSITANKELNRSDSLVIDTGEEVSPFYKALMKIGFIGCIDTDEQLSTRYKGEIDFSKKYSEKP